MPTKATEAKNRSFAFKFVAGHPSLDFVNTVDWTEQGLRDDRLTDYDDLVLWGERSGVIPVEVASQLTAQQFSPQERTAALFAAQRLRDILQEIFARIADGREPDKDALQMLNESLGDAFSRLHLCLRGGEAADVALHWSWRGMGSEPTCMLWPVVKAAAALLAGEDVQRLRVCAGVACGWMYLDRSRNGLRRWCEMSTCGARAKARRHYEKTRARIGG